MKKIWSFSSKKLWRVSNPVPSKKVFVTSVALSGESKGFWRLCFWPLKKVLCPKICQVSYHESSSVFILMSLSLYLYVSLFIFLSLYSYVCFCFSQFVYLSVRRSVMKVHLSLYLFSGLVLSPSVSLFVSLSLYFYLCHSICLSICMSVFAFLFLVCLSVCPKL